METYANKEDSPFRPLFRRDTKGGNERYTGEVVVDGVRIFLQVFPNQQRRHEKQPAFNVIAQRAREREGGEGSFSQLPPPPGAQV